MFKKKGKIFRGEEWAFLEVIFSTGSSFCSSEEKKPL
jgi:hypothetical protein